jgi:protein SCO1
MTTKSSLPPFIPRRSLFAWAAAGGTAWLAPCRAEDQPARPQYPGGRYSDLIPDSPLQDQRGRALRFYSDCLRDRISIIAFMYTRCQGTCPASSGLLARLRRDLAPVLGPAAVMHSISLDPAHDTPAVLAEYAEAMEAAGDAGLPWSFLTGKEEDIEQLRTALGYRDPDPAVDAIRSNHAAIITFGNDTLNRWGALPAGLPYPQFVAGMLRIVAPGTPVPESIQKEGASR